jgi:starch-binding outer membrane protein, SusD/RagB family
MINIKKYAASLLLAPLLVGTLGLNSCQDEKFFELEAPPITAWKNISDLELAISRPYRLTFVDGENSIGIMTHFIHLMMSDMVRRISDNPGWMSVEVYMRETEKRVNNTESKYRPAYLTISACNFILDFLATDPFPNASESDRTNNINRIKGEALFLRAYAYYHLAQLHAPAYDPAGANDSRILVLRTKFASDVTTALDNAPASTKEVYDQIAADFKEATSLLPKEWATGMPQAYRFGRATKHAAAFYYAKTLLHMGKYDEALTELNGILNDPQKPRGLEPDPETAFTNNSSTAPFNSPEVIFHGFYADPLRSNLRHPINIYYFVNQLFPDPNDYRDWWIISLDNQVMQRANIMVNKELTTEWKNDKRSKLFYLYKGADPSATLKGRANTEYFTNANFAPYVGKDDPVLLGNKYYRVPRYQNMPLIRSAEAYLLRAAIKAHKNDGPGAAADLNVVRQRDWDTSKSGPYVPLTTATWDQVDVEWLKELAFEADRVSFLQMFRKPIGPAGRQGVAPVLPPYPNFYWKIPIGETDFR